MLDAMKFLLLTALAVGLVTSQNLKAEQSEKHDNYRLPSTIVPISYNIRFTQINFDEFTFKGVVEINARVVKETNDIVLHRGNLTAFVTSVSSDSTKYSVSRDIHNTTTEKWTIPLRETLKPKDEIKILLSFNGILRSDMIGFYKSSYFEGGQEKWLAATQFETTHARHAFPCFDEPAMKAKFKISIKLPEGYGCLSNMPHTSARGWCSFEESVPMSTYLIAFLISDFESLSQSKFSVWSRPEAINQAKYALKIGVDAIKNFENLLDERYQIPKMDMVAIPDFSAGAMENWGLITYRETAMLYDDVDSSDAAQQRVASVIVHECAHMWFGNLVTPDWWSYLWLSEAFARYFQYMATDMIVPDKWRMDQQFVVEQLQAALGVDALEDSEAMTRSPITQAEIGNMGDSITYAKGASIVRMMEQTYGNDVFYRALRSYLKNRSYKSATPNHLWEALQKEVDAIKDRNLSSVSVAQVMKTWTEQPGFPYVKVTIKPESIKLSQERFLLRKLKNTLPTDTTWIVPITWTSSSRNAPSTKPVYWLSKRNLEVRNPYKNDDWLILNVKSAGFYRVSYDNDSWYKIIKVLTSNDFQKIDELNRAAIVDDLLNLARAELLNYEIALQGIEYLKRETNYLPFKSAFNALDYLIRKFSTSPDNEIFKNYVVSLFENIYQKLSYDDKKGDDRLTILFRQEINNRACDLDHSLCVKKSQEYFADWKKNKKPIPKNQRSAAYCTAIKYGTAEDWNLLYEKYRNSNVAAEQVTILSALGCSKDTKILERYLLTALSSFKESAIRRQDVSSVFSSVYSASVQNAEYLLEFVDKHHKAIHNYFKGYNEIGTFISGAVKKYPTKEVASKLDSIIKNNATHIKSIITSLEKTQKLMNFELKWQEKHYPTIINWIKANREINPSNENTTAYRLPDNVIPSAYTIHLTPLITAESKTFDGAVKILADVKKDSEKIVLHTDAIKIVDMKIHQINADGKPSNELKVADVTETKKYLFTNIIMERPIKENTRISIEMKYTGTWNAEMRGFYKSYYKYNNEKRWLAATHLEPWGARRMFPCFDEPALKATFDISVDVPENYTAISNMEVKSKKGNYWEFNTTPVMSTYLVALIVSDFESKFIKDNERTYGVYASPAVSHQLNYSLEVMKPITEFFEKKLGHAYSLPKLDMVALPDFPSGAMENWGLITYRETGMLYDPSEMSSLAAKQSIRNVIAHEITHQWFGNLVSPLWWDYVWLSEGFARYFEDHAYTEAESSWNLETQFVVDHLQTSFTNDASTGTHPVSAKVYSPAEIRSIFDKISYAKAASLIRMMEKLVGQEVFYGALYRYLNLCRYSTGTPEALFAAFQSEMKSKKSVKFNVTSFMNTWTRQSGFPVVNVKFDGDTATLTQTRFFLRPVKNDTNKVSWQVPINWATRSNPDFNNTKKVEWLNKKLEVKVENANTEWVIFNLQQTGYYRVNYDEPMWRRIITALKTDERLLIHEINRASLIDDLLNLGRAGILDYDIVISGISYISEEIEYAPWKAAYTGLTYLTRRFAGRPKIFDEYRSYILRLLEPIYEKLGFEDRSNEKHTDTLLRRLVLEWSCNLDQEECVRESIRFFKKEQNDPEYRVPPNQRSTVYCTAIRHGTSEDWDYLWKRHQESYYTTEKLTIIGALACSKKSEHLKSLMSETIKPDGEVRFQDAKKIFTNVIDGGLTGVKTILEFIEDNYESMTDYFGNDSATVSLLSTISKRLSTDELMQQFKNFVTTATRKRPELAKSLQSYLKRANIELNWFNERGPKIHELLRKSNVKEDYRLPTYAKPEHYDIHIKPYFEERNFTFDGNVTIDVNIEDETNMIVLHSKDLSIEKIYLEDDKIQIDKHEFYDKTQKLIIYFKNRLTKGMKLKLKFDYTGILGDDMRGFYRSYYLDDNGDRRWLASSHFEPVYARRAFPCFDEPLFKAKFTMHIAKPKGYRTLSNMGSSPRERIDGKKQVWDDYETSIKMAPYLLAFVVSDFVKIPDEPDRVAVWAKPQLKNYLNYAPVAGSKALTFLENFTDIAYPLKEMNFVAIPDFDMGAMENWGLVTFREYGLTYDENEISATYKRYADTVISHELVHMWFGNLVTCEWWDYTWLNEGFAQYVEYLVSNSSQPSWELFQQFIVNEVHPALEVDSLSSTHPMNNKIRTPVEAQDGFDQIAYKKSASVLRMFHHSFEQRAFVRALHNYLDSHKYSTARPEYLVAAIQQQLDKEAIEIPGNPKVNVTSIMNSWITQPGYPVVNVTRHGADLMLSQERFILSSSKASDKDRTYWIPITYTTESQRDFNDITPKLWLGKENDTINLESNEKWYILNVREIGFYRVNYDKENWLELTKVLNSENYADIDVINRAQIIDDAFNLARAGYIDYNIPFDISTYLVRETNYLPWKAFFSGMAYLAQRFEGQSSMKELYVDHLLTMLNTAYEKLGFKEDLSKDAHLDQLNRELILSYACKYEHKDCVEKSKTHFKENSVTPNIATAVYCTVVKHGNENEWNLLWDKYKKSGLAAEYLIILRGLGCSQNETILEKYIDHALEPNSHIRKQDIGTAFSSIYSSSQIGLQTAFNYFDKNLEKLHKYYGNWHEVGSIFKYIASYVTTEEQIKNFEKLSNDERKIVSNIKSDLKTAINKAKQNFKWFEINSKNIQIWLKNNEEKKNNGPNSAGRLSMPVLTHIFLIFINLTVYLRYW